ncbi:MAG TPA: thiamine pyrophosphate-dependent enzyme [Candidatus Gastranaerophilales bacterium]|nr:thiamine pyrophosphate-dependent enzyme [Candidatus Gastranaerophilales bacterium]
MDAKIFDMPCADIAWCPGCGNFLILKSLKDALTELDIKPENLVMVSGVGSASKTPHYIRANVFDGLHGRILPPACAIKAVNPELTVVAVGGDGDMYGEGGNHLIHAIRRNSNITNIVHNNMLYCLTRKQASPSSSYGLITPVQTHGVTEEPFNPVAIAISAGATFVARAFCTDTEKTKEIIKKAILHKGYSLVDVLMPCVTFEVNSYKWFKENSYYLEQTDKVFSREEAFKKAIEIEKLPLGIFYIQEGKATFEENQTAYKDNKTPLVFREISRGKMINDLLHSYT